MSTLVAQTATGESGMHSVAHLAPRVSTVIASAARMLLIIAVLWLSAAKPSLAEPVRQDAESAVNAPWTGSPLAAGATFEQGSALDVEPVASPLEVEPTNPPWWLGNPKHVLDVVTEADVERQPLQEALLREAALFREHQLLRQERDAHLMAQRAEAVEANHSRPVEQVHVVRWDLDRSETNHLAALLQFLKENRVLLLGLALCVWMAFQWWPRRARARRKADATRGRRIRKRIKVRLRRRIRVRRRVVDLGQHNR